MSAKALWKCPNCGREFGKRDQWHSCVNVGIDAHFAGKPPVLNETFKKLLEKMAEFGPVRADAVKSSINFAGNYHFAGVKVLKNALRLGFSWDSELEDPRIVSSLKIYENSYVHRVKLSAPGDIDAQLLSWLERSYKLKNKTHKD